MSWKQRVGFTLGLVVWLSCAGLSWAAPWAVVVGEVDQGGRTGAVSMVDMGTVPPTVHGPFLAGQVSTNGGGLFDVVLSPDNSFALISDFGDSIIFKVDITDPLNPVLVGQTNLQFFAEDIAMAPNGQFALVTDGGFQTNVASIDLTTFAVSYFGLTNGYANAVAIAPDNETVIFADYFSFKIVYGKLNSTKTGLQAEHSLLISNSVTGLGRPVNVTISPDGRTALLADASTNNLINVLQISTTGEVTPGITPTIFGIHTNFSNGNQSIVFSRDGTKAYIGAQATNGTFLSWVQINGPGNVTMGKASAASVAMRGTSQLFGVDTLAVTPDSRQLLFSNPTQSGATNLLSVVNLTTFAVTEIDSLMRVPVGLAMTQPTGLVLNDYNGDGQSDLTVYYSANGRWYAHSAADLTVLPGTPWGYKGAKPVPGDFDGDGTSDLAVYDLKTMKWYIQSTVSKAALAFGMQWGTPGANPVSGDYNGDGISDPAFYNAANGKWYAKSMAGTVVVNGRQWGYKGALPMPGDYDGDGISDLAVYDPQNGNWFIQSMASSTVLEWGKNWGFQGSTAVPGDYNGDGIADLAVYSRYDGKWYILSRSGVLLAYSRQWGYAGAVPVPGDFNGDGVSDLAVYDPGTGKWYIQSMSGTVLCFGKVLGFKGTELVLP